jgi:hypothetical protein
MVFDFLEQLGDVKITKNGDVYDIDGNIMIGFRIDKFPIKFGKVSGEFIILESGLTTLEGCPSYIGGDFSCTGNRLTSLEGCPSYVGGKFGCSRNKLTTLKGIEKCEIIGGFYCWKNDIIPENYIYILTANIGGEIFVDDKQIQKILNTYKNEVKYLHKALSELKKEII